MGIAYKFRICTLGNYGNFMIFEDAVFDADRIHAVLDEKRDDGRLTVMWVDDKGVTHQVSAAPLEAAPEA